MKVVLEMGLVAAVWMGPSVGTGAAPLLPGDGPLLEKQLQEVGDARFHLPRGWKIKTATEGEPRAGETYLHLTHVDEDGEISQIALMQVRGTRGQLKQSALTLLSADRFGFDVTLDDVTLTEARQGYPVAYVRDWARSDELKRGVEARAFAMKPKSALELVLYLSTADGVAEYEREAEFEAFMRDLRFASAKDPIFDPMTPRASVDRINALAYTTSLVNTFNAFGGMDLDTNVEYVYLAADGHYTRTIPADGRLDRIDWEKLLREEPTDAGVYEIRRKKGSDEARLILRTLDEYGFLDEVEGRLEFEPAGDAGAGRETREKSKVKALEIDGSEQLLLPPLERRRLRGRYTYIYGSTGSTAFSSGSFSGSKTIVFTRTGKFESSGYFAASFSHETGGSTTSGVTGSEKPSTRGTYSLEGHTLTLHFDDGTVAERFCHPCGDEDDAMLMIDESPYLFKGRR
ncbi:hypothetical protein Poly30_12850 [Planctomycetes bacterium Poly30]|uniref:Uncharacterized protein n=1 Tax=Saltatorellus ferox TaxID=2528018 RepID=A0A518ENY0_9BACT|nr:hypothetical protein Poly30_12850 [Planctomycetes bacterium Poly30]